MEIIQRPTVSYIPPEDGLNIDDGYDKIEYRPTMSKRVFGRQSITNRESIRESIKKQVSSFLDMALPKRGHAR